MRLIPFTAVRAASLVSLSVLGLSATGAFAASQGTPGDTSSGTTTVTASVPPLIRIFNLADINLGTYNPSDNDNSNEGLSGSTDVCVLMNNSTTYNVIVSSDTAAFQLDSASASDSIAFTAEFNGSPLTYNTALAGNTPDSASSLAVSNCDSGDADEFVITIDETVLEDALAANDYTATLTLLVAED
ncbi:MAG: hypothetical protein ABF271_03720 [Abyssibacter sp.]|uniref:hypothetical protein n=1 Tax=Abyssibacter sp. TaxID=2320200 RepID=UPI00321AF09A